MCYQSSENATNAKNLDIMKKTESEACCGYCQHSHLSTECQNVHSGDYAHYRCNNCQEHGRTPSGHSSHWYKCPTYLELQQKMKNSIPFYHKKN